jgi:hemoglobin
MSEQLFETVNGKSIQKMVNSFYAKIIKDPLVGPFFTDRFGDDIESQVWKEHLLLLGNFWSQMMLGSEDYHGHPMAPHFEMHGISRKAFEQWLLLFSENIDEIFVPKIGQYFKNQSIAIADRFMLNLGL